MSTEEAQPTVAEIKASAAENVRRIRSDRRRRLITRVVVGVGLPTLLAIIYFSIIVTPQFESTTLFTIHSSDGAAAPSLSLFLGAMPSGSSARDTLLAKEYILSRGMLNELIEGHGFLEHYRTDHADFFSRLPSDASSEAVYEYYLDHVLVDHDLESGVLTVSIRAFSADDAHRLASAILEGSEAKVNVVSDEARRDAMSFAESEVSAAEVRLTAARLAVVQLQQEGAEINPVESAGAVIGVRGSLETSLAQARAELSALLSSMQPGAPRVLAQRSKVSALVRQVEAQNRRLIGEQGSGLSQSIARFEPAVIEKEFAQKAYESALASLELARVEAARQHRYVVRIAEPSRPDAYTHPSIARGILTVFVLSIALLGIGTLLLAALREHANV